MVRNPAEDHVADGVTALLNGAADKLQSGGASSRPLREVCWDLKKKVDAFLESKPDTPLLADVQSHLRVSLQVVDEALERYRPEHISISYNGGKDCLVLLITILACLARRYPEPAESSSTANPPNTPDPTSFPETFQAVYIVSSHPFAEVDSFVASSSAEYHLELERYTLPMKEGLEAYLADRPNIQAIFVGTRRADPHGEKLTHFDPTDAGWPSFMRVHPVIDWHYAEIWAFVRALGVPYCSLYDQGYTSLGGKTDTHPNPQLKKDGESGKGFRPAYELMADEEERLGRE